MTKREIEIFERHHAAIITVLDSISRRLEGITIIGNKEADELRSTILNTAASVILERGLAEKPDHEVRAYLYTYYMGNIRNLYRREIRTIRRSASQEDLDALTDDGDGFMESSVDMAKLTIETILNRGNEDIQALCKVYLEHGSFDAAMKCLGWSKGKIYRTKLAAEALFRKNCRKSGGFYEPTDI